LSELDPSSLVGFSTGTENGKFGLENGFWFPNSLGLVTEIVPSNNLVTVNLFES
jgi:hypothetical protein